MKILSFCEYVIIILTVSKRRYQTIKEVIYILQFVHYVQYTWLLPLFK